MLHSRTSAFGGWPRFTGSAPFFGAIALEGHAAAKRLAFGVVFAFATWSGTEATRFARLGVSTFVRIVRPIVPLAAGVRKEVSHPGPPRKARTVTMCASESSTNTAVKHK